jgi:hypothetical protein
MFLKIRKSKMKNKNKIELTLFVREIESLEMERIRAAHNREQYKLIKNHNTKNDNTPYS